MNKIPKKTLEGYLLDIERYFKKVKKYPKLGEGAFRVVLQETSKTVIKIPIDDMGISCNLIENIMFKKYSQSGILAKCNLFYFKEIPILRMEYVTLWKEAGILKSKLPKWATKIDCAQVGLNSKGKLVCFDYAHNWDVILGQKLKINLISKWY